MDHEPAISPASPAGIPAPRPANPRRVPGHDVSKRAFAWAGGARSKEGALYHDVVGQLRAHLGRPPTATETLLISRIAWVQVHLTKIDERAVREGALSPHAIREYLAWANSLARMLDRFGLQPPAPRKPTPEEALAAIRSQIGGAA